MTTVSPTGLPEVTDAATLYNLLTVRESAAGGDVSDAEATRSRAKAECRLTGAWIDALTEAGIPDADVAVLRRLDATEVDYVEAVAHSVTVAHGTQRAVLVALWWAARHAHLARQGATGPFYTGAAPAAANGDTPSAAAAQAGGMSPREAVAALREIGEGVRWLSQSEGDPRWRPSEQTPELAAQLAADDKAEDQGLHGDDRQTCGVHRSWLTDCISDPSHSNPATRYNWCTVHSGPVQICECWPANVDGTPARQNPADDDGFVSSDAATWSAADTAPEDEPLPQTGRRPRAGYMDWRRSQLVNLGAAARNEWYWQCPTTGCKVWAGPYSDPIKAKKDGFEHIYKCEKTDYFRRGQQP
jgi:hypothetical protein